MSLWDQVKALTAEQRETLLADIDAVSERNLESAYNDSLDSIYEPYVMGEMTFNASDVLANCDDMAWRCGYADFVAQDCFVEIDGEYYNTQDVEDALEQFEETET